MLGVRIFGLDPVESRIVDRELERIRATVSSDDVALAASVERARVDRKAGFGFDQ